MVLVPEELDALLRHLIAVYVLTAVNMQNDAMTVKLRHRILISAHTMDGLSRCQEACIKFETIYAGVLPIT